MASLKTFTLAVLATATISHSYKLVDEHKGLSFFEGFDFFTEHDPTNGTVAYQSMPNAINSNLVGVVPMQNSSNPAIYIGVDSTKPSASNRPSIRLTSKKSYNHFLMLADVIHMPTGCGIWPAIWATGPNWPTSGEIDILEQVNGNPYNQATLHTSANCAISPDAPKDYAGELVTANCDVNAPNQSKNAGCGIRAPENQTFTLDGQSCEHGTAGDVFNAQTGGILATLWDTTGVSIYFFPREYIPTDISSGSPNPDAWTKLYTPQARFSGSGCDFDSSLKDLSIVINTSLCGDWAGNTWEQDGCAKKTGVETCERFVNEHPEAFKEAYWLLGGVSVFQK